METKIRSEIRQLLTHYFRNYELRDDEDIFAAGFVNSLLGMQIVNFAEKTYGITVDDEDLDIDNFRTINAIVALIQRKQASS